MKLAKLFLRIAASAGCVRVCAAEPDLSKLPPVSPKQIDFARDIQPILEANCLRCHGPEKPRNGFRLDNRAAALKGGDNGSDILPGNSAKSPLIQYVSYLVEDSEMPPVGKGNRLSAEQVSSLRAWIDQGAKWNGNLLTNSLDFSFSPAFGGTIVNGDKYKYRELNWQEDGLNGGLEEFNLFHQTPDTKWQLSGHALLNDYKVELSVDRNDFGFIHSGWEQYRKYYDGTGGYAPDLLPAAPSLNQDLHLDIGKAWVDFGLNLPDWPRLVLGYEYDYRDGSEASTEWSAIGSNQNFARNIGPVSQTVREDVHTIKFDLDDEIKGVTVEDRFRGEFYHLGTSITNAAFNMVPQNVSQQTTYFQGANTLRLEKKFTDWLLGSAGWLYSRLNADSAFQMDAPGLQQITSEQIPLERESNVGNVNGLIGPLAGLLISGGAEAEWTRQRSLGSGLLEQENGAPPPFFNLFTPFTTASAYDTASVQEDVLINYSKIPFTGVYAEGRLNQEVIDQYDQFSAVRNILNKAVFLQYTDFHEQISDLRAGFDTSPWRSIFFDASYHQSVDDSDYDSGPLIQPTRTAYPTFIRSRDIMTSDTDAKLVWQPCARFKTTLAYQYEATDYEVNTRPYVNGANVISPGGPLLAAADHSNIYSVSATFMPFSRLFLSSTFSWQESSLATAAGGSPSVQPYRGDIYTLFADGTFVLGQNTDLLVGYFYSSANYGQNNFANGLPLGLDYQRHSAQIGLSRHIGRNVSARLQYRFDYYNEPSSGGADNYVAQSIFGVLSFTFK